MTERDLILELQELSYDLSNKGQQAHAELVAIATEKLVALTNQLDKLDKKVH